MRDRKPLSIAVVLWCLAAGVVLTGCDKQPQGPTLISIVNNNTNTNQNGQSGTDPSDPDKVIGSVKNTRSVTVNGFANGEKCPTGIAPANDNRKIRNGCDLAVTCNPRDAEGKVIQDDKAPPVDYFILATGQDVVSFGQSSSNTYNGDVRTKKPGKFALICSVVGISSGLQEFEVIP